MKVQILIVKCLFSQIYGYVSLTNDYISFIISAAGYYNNTLEDIVVNTFN